MKPIDAHRSVAPSRRWMSAFAKAAAMAAALVALSGCSGIGDGSTIQSLRIALASDNTVTSPFTVHRCLRDQVVALATFTDGTVADFSFRVTWASIDPSIVQVSDGDVPLAQITDGVFTESSQLFYTPGTLVPRAASGSTTITASFAGIRASAQVSIDTAALTIAPVEANVDPNVQPPALKYFGPATTGRFALLAREANGRTLVAAPLSLFGALNPILWSFVGGEYQAADTAVAGDFNKYAVPSAASPTAVIGVSTGLVSARAAEAVTYQIQASTSLCQAEPAFQPTADIRVVPFDATTPLTIAHEPDFNGQGVTPNGDMVAGSGETIVALANLDSDGDGVGDTTQDLQGQMDVAVTHTTVCTQGDINCTCDDDGSNCTKRLVTALGNEVFSLISDDGATADLVACFTDVDASHFDDCDEIDAGEVVAPLVGYTSNVISVQSIPVDLSATGGASFSVVAPAPAPAFTYPGPMFEAFGTFTALSGTPFAGGTSATATQKVTRRVFWSTRPVGDAEAFSDLGAVRNTGDSYYNGPGRFSYFKDVTANTDVDVTLSPGSPFEEIEPPAAVPFTVCPSTGC